MACTCGRIAIGMTITENRNWNPDCSEHGTDSAWWSSSEQIAKREAQNQRSRDLQTRAAEARRRSHLTQTDGETEHAHE